MNEIEIYVRHRSDGAMLNIHVNEKTKRVLLDALQNGSYTDSSTPINMELSLLPQWIVSDNETPPIHARIPITSISINVSE